MHSNFRKLKTLIRNNLNNIKTIAIEKFFELPLLEKPFPNDIFGKKPLKTKQYYLDLHKKALKNQNPKVAKYEKQLGFSLDNEWFNDVSLVTQTCIKNSPLNFNHGKILYTLVSKYIQDHKINTNITILETELPGDSHLFVCLKQLTIKMQKVKLLLLTAFHIMKRCIGIVLQILQEKLGKNYYLSGMKKY